MSDKAKRKTKRKTRAEPTYSKGAWVPRRDGERYCSPACGCGCTFAAYEKACTDAQQLANQLGPGWTTNIWEGMGWHYNVELPAGKGHLRVMKDLFKYRADFWTERVQFSVRGRTPKVAAASAIKELTRHIDALSTAREVIRKVVTP